MLRFLNEKILKNKKLKLYAASVAIAIGLSGCGITNNSQHNTGNNSNTSINYDEGLDQNTFDSLTSYKVEINYSNWTTEIQKDEAIYFTYENGTIYHGVGIKNDGTNSTTMKGDKGYIISSYLEKDISIPNISEGEKLVIDVDYSQKTLEAHTETLEKNMSR